MDEELEKQMSLLDGIDLSSSIVTNPVQQVQSTNSGNMFTAVQQPVQNVQQTVVPTQQTVVAQPIVQQPITQQANVQPPVMNIANVQAAPTIKTRKLGQPAYVNLIDKAKADPGQGIRIALFTDDIITVYTHFVSGRGYIACLSERDDETGMITNIAPCCKLKNGEELASPKTKFIIPVVEMMVMPNDKSYSIIPNTQGKLKVLIIGAKEYNQLNDLFEANQNINTYDLIAKTANDQWKTINFSPTSTTARGQIPNFQEEVNKWNDPKIKEAASNLAGRILKPEIIQRILDEQEATIPTIVTPSVDSLNI